MRDAQGNQLGVYDNNGGVFWREQQLYGSSRLGMWRPDTTLVTGAGVVAWSKTGRKSYELSNHLGNVLAVVSDKYAVVGSDPVAELLSAQDYYPFGMIQPGRSLSSANYRYGFNGKENDNEVKGLGNQQDYGMRIYDPRVGRFLSVDPITKNFPWYTPYQFAGNGPIANLDLDGLEEIYYLKAQKEKFIGFDNALKIVTESGIMRELKKQFASGNGKTDIYFNITPLAENHHGSTGRYDNYDGTTTGKALALQDIRSNNPSMPLQSVLDKTLLKDKQAIIIQLNEDDVIEAKSNIDKLKELALTIVHEISAHAIDQKDGEDNVSQEKEHQDFYNNKDLRKASTNYKDIKKDSPAGKYKERIEKATKKLTSNGTLKKD